MKVIHQKHPEVFIPSGIMERGNFSAAAGFGFDAGGVAAFFKVFERALDGDDIVAVRAALNIRNARSHLPLGNDYNYSMSRSYCCQLIHTY